RQGRQRSLTTWQEFDEANEVGISGSAVTTWTYNPLGLLESKEDHDLNSVDYTYTPAGRLQTRINARAITTTYSYDPDTWDLLGASYDDGLTPSVTYSFDHRGRVETIADASGSRLLTYENGVLMDESYTAWLLADFAIDRR